MNELVTRLKGSFKAFLWYIWRSDAIGLKDPITGEPVVPTDVQYDIAEYLEDISNKRIIIEAFRGVGKSWVTAAYALWLLYCNPQVRIMVVSASKERADSFSIFCKKLISEVDVLKHLQPDKRKGQRDSNLAFDVAPANTDQSPSMKSVGITGQITGSRADVIIADDIETPKNSLTETQRERLSELVKEFDAVIKPGGRIIYLGTPQCLESLYNRLPERGYKPRIWCARYPDEEGVASYNGTLAPFILNKLTLGIGKVGVTTDPQRFSDADLRDREGSYGRSGFALQFMLDTSLSDANRYPLKTADLIVMDLDNKEVPVKTVWSSSPDLAMDLPNYGLTGDRFYRPMHVSNEWSPYSGIVLAIDPSGRGSDETGYAVVAMLHGKLYVLACGGTTGGYTDAALTELAGIAKHYKVTDIVIESNFGDGMFTQLFKPILYKHYECAIEEVNHNKQKELRIIDTLEPVMNQHRLVINRSIITQDELTVPKDVEQSIRNTYMLFYQLTHITRERGALKHDDRLDALAIAVHRWVELMAQDEDVQIAEEQEEAKAAMIEAWLEESFTCGVLGLDESHLQIYRS